MRTVLWENTDSHGVEYCDLVVNSGAVVLEGTVILPLEGLPTCITYRIECDSSWRTRAVVIHQKRAGETKDLELSVTNKQIWHTKDSTVPFASGIYDVDLEITPSSNTLPIRRIGLKVGESQQVDAVCVRFPGLTLERLRQRYTRIDKNLYKYENPLTGYEAQLEVDEQDLVVRYGNLWRRVGA